MNGDTTTPIVRLIECDVAVRSGAASRLVLEKISLDLRAGELVLVRGKSGSGKTTLAMLLAGLLEPSSGRVENNLPRRNRQSAIQMVFQDPYVALNPVFTSAYWLRLAATGGAIFGARTLLREARVANARMLQLMERFKLAPGLLLRRAGELSGGEQQRFALIATLLTSPICLVLDEPTSMLDVDSRRIVEGALSEFLQETKTSIVLLTHEEVNVAANTQRCLVIDNGRLLDDT